MVAVRFEITDPAGHVQVDNGMLSFPEGTDPKAAAYEILSGSDNKGWSVRLWLDVDLVGGLDRLGDPDAWLLGTGTPWIRCLPLAMSAGHVVPDVQASEAYAAAWIAPLADGTWAYVHRSYYICEDVREDNNGLEKWMERRDEYLNCHRPSDPGGTEINAKYVYDDVGRFDEDAEQLAIDSFTPKPGEWKKYCYSGCCGDLADGS